MYMLHFGLARIQTAWLFLQCSRKPILLVPQSHSVKIFRGGNVHDEKLLNCMVSNRLHRMQYTYNTIPYWKSVFQPALEDNVAKCVLLQANDEFNKKHNIQFPYQTDKKSKCNRCKCLPKPFFPHVICIHHLKLPTSR